MDYLDPETRAYLAAGVSIIQFGLIYWGVLLYEKSQRKKNKK